MLTKFKLFENVKEEDFLTDCKPIIKELKKIYPKKEDFTFLYRGFLSDVSPSGSKFKTNKFREPRDTHEGMHEVADDAFDKYFGWRARSQGIFVLSSEKECEQYGYVFLYFPIGEYKFVWSPEIRDLTPELNGDKDHIEQEVRNEYWDEYDEGGKGSWRYINRIDTKESDLKNAVKVVKKDPKKYNVKKKFDKLSFDDNISIEDFYWHPEIDENDFWNENAHERIINHVNHIIKTQYKENDLYDAMSEQGYQEYHEITFKCDEYYLFPLEMKEELIDLIYVNKI